MSDDIIKRLREAIAAGPTPGPWTVTEYEGCWYVDVPEDRAAIYHGDGVAGSNTFHQDNGHKANMQFIAAASPDNIAALLDRLDAAERENEALTADARMWRVLDKLLSDEAAEFECNAAAWPLIKREIFDAAMAAEQPEGDE